MSETRDPAEGMQDVGPALRQARDDIDELTRRCVARARERGRSWVTIGEGLGVTRQAAQKRFDPPA